MKSDRSTYMLMDAMRFFAALCVVIGHTRSLLFVDATPNLTLAAKLFYFLTGFGHQAVIVFFVLSGFWISRSVAGRIDRPDFWRNYLIARLSRLWIVLIPALALGSALDLAGREWVRSSLYIAGNGSSVLALPFDFALTTIMGNVGFLQSLTVPVLGSNGPLWSIAFEFWFYIWFPALVLAKRGRISFALIALAMGALVPGLLLGFTCWLAGSTLYFATKRRQFVPKPLLALVLTTSLMLVGMAGIAGRLNLVPAALSDFVLAAGFGLALYVSITSGARYGRWLKPFAHFGARASYSLYAIHFPIILLAAALTHPARGAISISLMGLAIAIIGLAVASGWLFSRLTETQTDRLRRWIGRRWDQPVHAAAPGIGGV